MLNPGRVEWSELRATGCERPELFLLIAESNDGCWEFFERSSWEVRWYQIKPTPELVARLSQELAGRDVVASQTALTRAAARGARTRPVTRHRQWARHSCRTRELRPGASALQAGMSIRVAAANLSHLARNQLPKRTLVLIIRIVFILPEDREASGVQQESGEDNAAGPG